MYFLLNFVSEAIPLVEQEVLIVVSCNKLTKVWLFKFDLTSAIWWGNDFGLGLRSYAILIWIWGSIEGLDEMWVRFLTIFSLISECEYLLKGSRVFILLMSVDRLSLTVTGTETRWPDTLKSMLYMGIFYC